MNTDKPADKALGDGLIWMLRSLVFGLVVLIVLVAFAMFRPEKSAVGEAIMDTVVHRTTNPDAAIQKYEEAKASGYRANTLCDLAQSVVFAALRVGDEAKFKAWSITAQRQCIKAGVLGADTAEL